MSQIEEIKDFVAQVGTSLGDSAQEMSGDTEFLRATKKVAFINKRINLLDEDLVPPNLIATLNTHLSKAKDQILAYVTSKEKAPFDKFIEALNEAISVITSLPVLSNVELDDVTYSFSELTAQKLTALEKRVHALNAEQDRLIRDFQGEWRELIDGSEEKSIAGAKKDVEAAIEKLNDRMNLAFDGEGDNVGWTALAIEKLKEIEGVKARAKELGVLIADGTTSGSYREQAKSEIWAYRWWRFITVLVAVAWICTIFSTPLITFIKPIVLKLYEIELQIPDASTGMDLFYSRLMSSLPFVAIAAWASSIASNHRKSAIRFKQFEMDLAAFEPSLENVDAAQRSAAKFEFVKTTFGKNHDVVDPTTADLLKKVIDKLGDATNKLADKLKL
jgi:hypothetical protein